MQKTSRWKAFVTALAILAVCGSAAMAQTPQPTTAPAAAAACPPAAEKPAKSEFDKAVDSFKNPTDWLSFGLDERLRDEYSNNVPSLNKHNATHERHYQRYRTRFWTDIKPLKDQDLTFHVRFTNEFRNYCLPKANDLRDTKFDEVVVDELYVDWKKIGNSPLSVKVGRQDMIFGNGWLINDGTPLDGSRTNFFDAARLTYDAKPIDTVFDVVYLDNGTQSDRWIEPFNDQERDLIESHERGLILYASNKSIKDTTLDGYFIYKHDDHVLSSGIDSNIYTFGGRMNTSLNENWRARAELAQQLGDRNGDPIQANGANGRLEYHLNDCYKNNFRMSGEYLSGNDPDSSSYEGFDPLWGRWPQFSEIASALAGREARAGEVTNLYRTGPGWSICPAKDMTVDVDYYLMWAPQNTAGETGVGGFSDQGSFRGQLISAVWKWQLNKYLSNRILGEAFFPGSYYADSSNDSAVFLRYEWVIKF